MSKIKPFILVIVDILIGAVLGYLAASMKIDTISIISLILTFSLYVLIMAITVAGVDIFIQKFKKKISKVVIGILVVIFIIGIVIGYDFVINSNETIRNSKELTMNMLYYSNWITLV